MEQIDRICEMETIFRETSASLSRLSGALEDYTALLPQLEKLIAYYDSPDWRADYADDEAGQLPPDLPRGVLSQDGVWNLLTEQRRLLDQMTELIQK